MKIQSYKIIRNPYGDRAVKLASGAIIPADIASLASGPDAWLSRIECTCRDCGERFPLRHLYGNGQWCQDCQDRKIDCED